MASDGIKKRNIVDQVNIMIFLFCCYFDEVNYLLPPLFGLCATT